MTAAGALTADLEAGRYEAAALRLLAGFLIALRDTAPPAREAMLTLLTREGASGSEGGRL
ncbi:MAG: hypothetical protein EPO65_06450 [Dehalococcoidia bacterium]|nr:MAG: hypothetical protein EPO65_06450 [Dehalococcoidia bacterium]